MRHLFIVNSWSLIIYVAWLFDITNGLASAPNFIFLLSDDWGWGDIGAHHSINHPKDLHKPNTPRIDQLAKEGTLFTSFHTMGAECSPSRASFMTGRSPSDKKVRIHLVIGDHDMNVNKGCADFLDPKTATVTSIMHDAGYMTGHFGKWHLGAYQGNHKAGLPAAPSLVHYGVQESVTYGSNSDVNPYFPNSKNSTNPFNDEWFPANSSRMIVDYGIDFITRAVKSKQPFYLNLWFHISHAPLNPTDEQLTLFPTSECPGPNPEKAAQRCSIQIYRASQYEADHQIGRLLDWLQSSHLKEDTVFVFSTDNGPEDPNNDMHAVGDPGPFRGRKRSLYEGGIRVPFIASGWKIPSGRISNADIASVDWLPTVASLAGITLHPNISDGLLGRDASNLLLGTGTLPSRALMYDYRFDNTYTGYCYHGAPRLAIQIGDMKLLTNIDSRFPRTELYNLTYNTFEARDLSKLSKYDSLVADMRKQLLAWVDTLDPIHGSSVINAQHLGCSEFKMPRLIKQYTETRQPWD